MNSGALCHKFSAQPITNLLAKPLPSLRGCSIPVNPPGSYGRTTNVGLGLFRAECRSFEPSQCNHICVGCMENESGRAFLLPIRKNLRNEGIQTPMFLFEMKNHSQIPLHCPEILCPKTTPRIFELSANEKWKSFAFFTR